MAQKRLMYRLGEAATKTRYRKDELLQKAAEGEFSLYIKIDKSKVLALVKDESPYMGMSLRPVAGRSGDIRFLDKYFISTVDLDFVSVRAEVVSEVLKYGEYVLSCVCDRPIFLGIAGEIKANPAYVVCSTLVYLKFSSGADFSFGSDVTDFIESCVVCESDFWIKASDINNYIDSASRSRSGRGPGLASKLIKKIVDNNFSGRVPGRKEMLKFLADRIGEEIYGFEILNGGNDGAIFVVKCSEGVARISDSGLKSALQRLRSDKINLI